VAESSKEVYGTKRAVFPMMIMAQQTARPFLREHIIFLLTRKLWVKFLVPAKEFGSDQACAHRHGLQPLI
jgi:hypothetical protein